MYKAYRVNPRNERPLHNSHTLSIVVVGVNINKILHGYMIGSGWILQLAKPLNVKIPYLKSMGKSSTWLHRPQETKQNKTVCIYCMTYSPMYKLEVKQSQGQRFNLVIVWFITKL